MTLRLFLFTCVLLLPSFAEAKEKLVFSIDLIRHGDRNPGGIIPKAPYPWQGELGALTSVGKEKERRLGEQIRSEMTTQRLLSADYEPGTIYVRSTDYSRTVESAESLLEGLYPKLSRHGKSIPIERVSKNKDDLLIVKPSGNIISVIKMYFYKKRLWSDLTQGLQNQLKAWEDFTGLKLRNFEELDVLADDLDIRLLNGIPLPSGIDTAAAHQIVSIYDKAILAQFARSEISGPTGQRLLTEMKKYFKQVTERKSSLRYVLFLAHDATLMSLLNTLKARHDYPPFAARLNLGLFEENDQLRVRVTLQGDLLYLPGCSSASCSWDDFQKL